MYQPFVYTNIDVWNEELELECNNFPDGRPFMFGKVYKGSLNPTTTIEEVYEKTIKGLTEGFCSGITRTEWDLKEDLYRKGDLHLYYCLVDKKTNKVRSIISQNYNGELNDFSHTGLELDVSSLNIDSIDFDGLCNEMIIQEEYLQSDRFQKTKYRGKLPSIPHKYKKIEVGGRLYKDVVPDNFPYKDGKDSSKYEDYLEPEFLSHMFVEYRSSPLDHCDLYRDGGSKTTREYMSLRIQMYSRDLKYKGFNDIDRSSKWSMTERLSRYMDFEIPYYGFGFWVSSNEIFNNKICYLGFPFQERLGRTPKEYGFFIPTFNVELFWKYVPEQINPKNKEIVSLTNK